MNLFKKFTKLIATVLVLTTLCGMTVFADSGNYHFDFPKREIYLAPGDEFHMYVWATDIMHDHPEYDTYSCYMVPHKSELGKSKKTYIWSDYKCGNSYIDIYIGEDEVNTGFTLYFYIDEIEEWDTVNVHIVEPSKSDVPYTKENAKRAEMGLEPREVSIQERHKIVNFY